MTKFPYLVVSAIPLKVMLSYIKYALDFPGNKANLHLPPLNILGGCAMLGLCTYSEIVECL